MSENTSDLPSIFIGSSSEALEIAREVELHLQEVSVTTIWKNGVFNLGEATLESLMNALDQFDFAVMILSPDDLIETRGSNHTSPRDNILFELGLFMGRLGRSRTFIVSESDVDLKLPSDLSGITRAVYKRRDNLAAALSPTCTPIIKAVKSLGFYEGKNNLKLSRATQEFENISEKVGNLIGLMARSRKVELQIVSAQFDGFIQKPLMEEIRRDIEDLEKILNQES
jgi:Predicted nucleotide-binding protein containing TIR-like domain